ncbi:MAG: phosphate/phosphite/phosphonate ABC transporter substrate-binding protein [Nitrospirae bacterium]|nr:phosphate/phosphite/phosphonate ABC transporter substrate-binding protein [Nitrospirota bacterium]
MKTWQKVDYSLRLKKDCISKKGSFIRKELTILKKASYAVLALLMFISISGCRQDEQKTIVLEQVKPKVAENNPNVKHIRIAVGGMITPKEGVAYYKQFLEYVQEKLGVKVDYVDKQAYGEVNEMLRTKQLDAAFVCSGPYVDGHEQFNLELLAAPQAYGETVYYSYIIVPKDSPFHSFSGLRGREFAFTDPLSNSGKLVPTYMLAKMNETPESFFSSFIFTKSHDKAIKAVAQGIVDAAAVDSLIWEYLNKINPEFTSKTRIIEKSPPYAIPPVVVHRDLDPELKKQLQQIFLNAHTDPKGRELLNKMMIDKFVLINDSAYDSVRGMKSWLEGHHAEKKD